MLIDEILKPRREERKIEAVASDLRRLRDEAYFRLPLSLIVLGLLIVTLEVVLGAWHPITLLVVMIFLFGIACNLWLARAESMSLRSEFFARFRVVLLLSQHSGHPLWVLEELGLFSRRRLWRSADDLEGFAKFVTEVLWYFRQFSDEVRTSGATSDKPHAFEEQNSLQALKRELEGRPVKYRGWIAGKFRQEINRKLEGKTKYRL